MKNVQRLKKNCRRLVFKKKKSARLLEKKRKKEFGIAVHHIYIYIYYIFTRVKKYSFEGSSSTRM